MKLTFNLSTCNDDLDRFESREDFESYLDGFDGVELMRLGTDERGIVTPSRVVGVHLSYFPTWYDFWVGDGQALNEWFGSAEAVRATYGSLDADSLVERVRADLAFAHAYDAEYVVYHVSECRGDELFTNHYRHSDEQVVDAAAQILNEAFTDEDGSIALLVENLWQSGFEFTRPEITARLMDEVTYPNRGVMLDTGHLMHTNLYLSTQDDAIDYVRRCIDKHGQLASYVRGVHLHQSLTGPTMRAAMREPPVLPRDATERVGRLFEYSFLIDKHQPVCARGVDELLESLDGLEWLCFELMSSSRAEHRRFLDIQRDSMPRTLLRTGHATAVERAAWTS